MKKKNYRFLFRFPRIFAIIFILFISIFALDIFWQGYTFRQTMWALFIHLIPTRFMIIALILSRKKYPLVAAIIFWCFGLRYATLNVINFFRATEASSMPACYYFVWIAIIALPALVVGFCFFRDRRIQKKGK